MTYKNKATLRRHPVTGQAITVDTVERDTDLMLLALEKNRHHFDLAAEAIGLSRRYFSKLARRYGIPGTLKSHQDYLRACEEGVAA